MNKGEVRNMCRFTVSIYLDEDHAVFTLSFALYSNDSLNAFVSLGAVVIQRAYRRHRDRTALGKMIAIKKLVQGNDM